jgi:hypothetical protein
VKPPNGFEEHSMARFRCRACETTGGYTLAGKRECPNCGSAEIQITLSIEEWGGDVMLGLASAQMADTNKFED